MLKKITFFLIIISSLTINPVLAGLIGVDVTVQNTIQSPSFTGGSEDPFGAPQTATVASTQEFPAFINAYDIDVADDSISFSWIDTPFSQAIGGTIGANVFDRNYFVFNLPTNVIITDIIFDPVASSLLTNSALPSAQIISSNQVMTVFGEGVIRDIGFNPVFTVTTSTSTVPVPAAVWLFGSGLIGLLGMRRNKLKAIG